MRVRRTGFVPEKGTKEKYERVWSHFVQRVLESIWCFGFAASIELPDPDLGSIPSVLSLELLRVGVYVDYAGRYSFVFYEENFIYGIYGHASMAYSPIPNVMVHTHTPPSYDGTIHSSIARIVPHLNQMLIATESDLRAIISNSSPAMWTQQRIAENRGPPNLTSRHNQSSRSNRVEPSTVFNDDVVLSTDVVATGAATTSASTAPPPGSSATMGASSASFTVTNMPQFHDGLRMLKLSDGQEGHAFASVKEPAYLAHYVEKYEQAVADAFKVPITLFCADKLMRRDRTSHAQRSEAETIVFEQNVRVLQQKMLGIVNDVSEQMYGARFRADALLMAQTNPAYAEIAKSTSQVQWEFETRVDPATVRQFWLEGSFKRDDYVAYMSHHYGINPDCFEPKPQLDLLELNGIEPPDEDLSKQRQQKKKKKS